MTELINTQELIKLIRAVVRDEFKRHGLSVSKKQNTEIKSRQSAPTATSEEKRLFKNKILNALITTSPLTKQNESPHVDSTNKIKNIIERDYTSFMKKMGGVKTSNPHDEDLSWMDGVS